MFLMVELYYTGGGGGGGGGEDGIQRNCPNMCVMYMESVVRAALYLTAITKDHLQKTLNSDDQ